MLEISHFDVHVVDYGNSGHVSSNLALINLFEVRAVITDHVLDVQTDLILILTDSYVTTIMVLKSLNPS